MENVPSLFAIGIGLGLASIAGLRAFLPLSVVGIFSLLLIFELPSASGVPGPALELLVFGTVVSLVVLLALTVLEISLDKVPAASNLLSIAGIPLGAVAGALLFAAASGATVRGATIAEALPELLAGAVVGGAVALVRHRFRPPVEQNSAGVSSGFLSTATDVVALVGAIVGIFVPLVPVLFVGFLLYFFYRVRKRRGRKYEGLRILGD